MRRRAAMLTILSIFLLTVPAGAAPADEGCADIYPAMALGPFPAEAPKTTPLFYAADDASGGSFSVRWTGFVCNDATVSVNAEYGDVPGSAREPEDYAIPQGQRTPSVCEAGCPSEATVTFPLVNDLAESVTESFTLTLSNPRGGALDPPSSAPFVLVDADGATRVAFDELEYAGTENAETLEVAVWRAGPVGAATQVPYEVRPTGGSPASEADYAVTSPNPLAFEAGDRVKLITLSIVNDRSPEPTESVEVALGTASGSAPAMPTTKTVSIADNEETMRPKSRLHHPRNGRAYARGAYQLREIHVFTSDQGGSGVVRAELALRRTLRGGRCDWYTGKRFRRGDCDDQRWLPMQSYSPDLFYRRVKELEPSRGTRIVSYAAYSRAEDGAGNVERDFSRGRNMNSFEVSRRASGR